MTMADEGHEHSFAIVGGALPDLAARLARLFTHPWVASYQVGFGPPLVRSSAKLIERVKSARSALDKLATYLELCVVDEQERARLIDVFRRLAVRRDGPIEAERLDELSARVLELSLRLYHPAHARESVRKEMAERQIDPATLPDEPPELLSGRILVRLSDPANQRMLAIDEVKRAAGEIAASLAIELRVPAPSRGLYAAWLAQWAAARPDVRIVELGDPHPHTRVLRDGIAR